MYKILPTERSNSDTDEVFSYLLDTFQSPQAAQSHRKALADAVNLLKGNPYIRPLVKDEKLAAKGLRFITVKNYMLFYRIDEENKTVKLEAFMYSHRNWQAILGDNIA
jgi:plasmid stabilization system protein ParE